MSKIVEYKRETNFQYYFCEFEKLAYICELPAKLKKTTVQIKERFDKLKIEKQKQDIRVIGFYSFGLIIN